MDTLYVGSGSVKDTIERIRKQLLPMNEKERTSEFEKLFADESEGYKEHSGENQSPEVRGFFAGLLKRSLELEDKEFKRCELNAESQQSVEDFRPAVHLQLIRDWLSKVENKFENFILYPTDAALNELDGAFRSADDSASRISLFKRVNGKNVVHEGFIADMKFVSVLSQKNRAFVTAASAWMFFRSVVLRVFLETIKSPTNDWQSQKSALEERCLEIADMMKPTYVQQAEFLFGHTGHANHRHCGAESEYDCSKLSSELYQFLRDNDQLDLQALANGIKESLQEQWKNFNWVVIALDNHKDIELQHNQAFNRNIWLQRFGKSKGGMLQRSEWENVVLSTGIGTHGCMLCYRATKFTDRALLVFWVERLPQNQDCREFLADLDPTEALKNSALTLEPNNDSGNVQRVIEKLAEHDVNYVLAIGYSGKHAIARKETQVLPLCLRDGPHTVFVWSIKTTLELCPGEENIIEESKTATVFVIRTKPEMGLPGERVAVKEIRLPYERHDKLQIRVDFLNNGFLPLRHLVHPNVVQHLRNTSVLPKNVFEPPKYQIIMEYCAGGTLSKHMERGALVDSEIRRVGRSVLAGLGFLHANNISHRNIYGKHLMFEGPEPGSGRIKIIALGRVRELLDKMSRSFTDSDDRLLHLYKPPANDVQAGSKSDIWSFGCVLILLATGKDPVWKRSPVIPEMISAELSSIIADCLCPDYYDRPTAEQILHSEYFS